MTPTEPAKLKIAIIGAGPAGLKAAEVLSRSPQAAELSIHVLDAMPTAGRKFLLAGIGGLNLTHSEPHSALASRYGQANQALSVMLAACNAEAIQAWASGLGIQTFVGSSGRIFPTDMKAAPLLRCWLAQLKASGVQFHMRHAWTGWGDQGQLLFKTPSGVAEITADRVILSLGGASWPQLGSNGEWVAFLQSKQVAVQPLQAANCGFDITVNGNQGWSQFFTERYAGHPLKNIAIDGQMGECVITQTGIEGSLVYALSSQWREAINLHGRAICHLDLLPQFSAERVQQAVDHPRGSKSLSSHLKSRLGLSGVKLGLLLESLGKDLLHGVIPLHQAIKSLPIQLARPRPIAEAISTAGGVAWDALSERLELKAIPGVYCAGEMLDWEAPTGGYLLTACLATGQAAAEGLLADGW
jgi:uncharacterized flavoprotein (TIGR03862 family)